MNKLTSYIIGPELLWLLIYFAVIVIIKTTKSPIASMDHFWVNTAYIIPFILIPLTFMLYFIPGVPPKWLLFRIWIVVLVGAHYALSKGLSAHSVGGPGVGTAYMMGMGFVIFMLIAGTIFALIKFR